MVIVTQLQGVLSLDPRPFEQALGAVKNKTVVFGKQIEAVGRNMALNISAPLAGLGGYAIKVFGEYERSLNEFQAATRASASEMAAAAAEAEKLGADILIPAASAADAATAMREFGKAGMSAVESTRAARGALLLQAAAGIEAGRAANFVASQLAAFNLTAADSTRVTDLFSAAVTATLGDFGDFEQAAKQSAAAFRLVGFSINDQVTSLGLLAQAGIKGSDAGTSLRVMMGRLVPSTKQARAALKALGVETLDASGNIKPLREQVRQFSEAIKRLPSGQKKGVLQAIFGEDAQRAAALLFQGVEAFDKMGIAVAKEGAAAAAAAARNKGLLGALDAIKSSLETISISAIKTVGQDLAAFARSIAGLINQFAALSPETRRFIVITAGIVIAIGPAISMIGNLTRWLGVAKVAFEKLGPAIATGRAPLAGFAAALGTTGALIGITIVALGTLAYAFATNMGGMRDAVIKGWNDINQGFADGMNLITGSFGEFWSGLLTDAGNFWVNLRSLNMEQIQQWGQDFKSGAKIAAGWFQDGLKVLRGQQLEGSKEAMARIGYGPKGGGAAAGLKPLSTAPRVTIPKLPTIKNPGIDALFSDKEKKARKAQKSPYDQQLEQLQDAKSTAMNTLAGRARGLSKELIDLRNQYKLLPLEMLKSLAVDQKTITTQDERKEQLKAFKEEMRQSAQSVKDAMKVENDYSRLKAKFPKLTEDELRAGAAQMADDREATKVQTKRITLTLSMKEAMKQARVEAEAYGIADEGIRLAMLGTNKTLDELTKADVEWGRQMLGLNATIEIGKKNVEEDRAEKERWLDQQHQVIKDLKLLRQGFDATVHGTKEAAYAWEQYGLVFADVDELVQRSIKEQMDLTSNLEVFKTFAEGVQGIFESMFNNLFENGFKGFFGNIIQGFSKLLQQIAVQFLTSQLMNMVLPMLGGLFGTSKQGSGAPFATGSGAAKGIGGLGGAIFSSFAPILGGLFGQKVPADVGGKRIELPAYNPPPMPTNPAFSTQGAQYLTRRGAPQMAAAGAGGGNVTIQMTVHTQDAGSFRKNEAAIQASMYRGAQRMSQRNGGGR